MDVKGQVDPDKRSDRNIGKMILYKWKIDEKYWKFDWRYIAARKGSTCTRLEFDLDSEFQMLFHFFSNSATVFMVFIISYEFPAWSEILRLKIFENYPGLRLVWNTAMYVNEFEIVELILSRICRTRKSSRCRSQTRKTRKGSPWRFPCQTYQMSIKIIILSFDY